MSKLVVDGKDFTEERRLTHEALYMRLAYCPFCRKHEPLMHWAYMTYARTFPDN